MYCYAYTYLHIYLSGFVALMLKDVTLAMSAASGNLHVYDVCTCGFE